MVHGGGSVEPAGGGVAEPRPEAFEEGGHATAGIPFAGGIEVNAQPVALQHVRASCESLVLHVGVRRDEPSRADADDEVLVAAEPEPAWPGGKLAGGQPDRHRCVPVAHLRGGGDQRHSAGVLAGDRAQAGDRLLLPCAERCLARCLLGHPARPDRPVVNAAALAAVPNRPLLPTGAGAVNPSPKTACHLATLASLPGSS